MYIYMYIYIYTYTYWIVNYMNQLVQHFWVQITSPMVDGSGMQGIGECQDLSFQHQNLERAMMPIFTTDNHNRNQRSHQPSYLHVLLVTSNYWSEGGSNLLHLQHLSSYIPMVFPQDVPNRRCAL